jgi:hypothetical protein
MNMQPDTRLRLYLSAAFWLAWNNLPTAIAASEQCRSDDEASASISGSQS